MAPPPRWQCTRNRGAQLRRRETGQAPGISSAEPPARLEKPHFARGGAACLLPGTKPHPTLPPSSGSGRLQATPPANEGLLRQHESDADEGALEQVLTKERR